MIKLIGAFWMKFCSAMGSPNCGGNLFINVFPRSHSQCFLMVVRLGCLNLGEV